MKRHLPVVAALAMCLIGSTCIPSLKASLLSQKFVN
jgi:hypothetical protein